MIPPRPQEDLTSGGVRNILTFDVEEYFHASIFEKVVTPDRWPQLESRVERNVERILDLLERYQVRATFFVLGWIGEHHPWVVKKIAAFGHEVASHGYDHRLIYQMSPQDFCKQLSSSLDILQGLTGKKILGFRAPSFSIKEDTLWAFEILAEAGIRYDSSIFPIFHDRYGIPQTPREKSMIKTDHGAEIIELPPSSIRILGQNLPFGGGGYFRLFPLWFTNWSLRRINSRGLPVVFYLHPWELDPQQPVLRIGFWEKFRHYSNLKIVERKLERVLQIFRFLPICEFLELEEFESERIPAEKLPPQEAGKRRETQEI